MNRRPPPFDFPAHGLAQCLPECEIREAHRVVDAAFYKQVFDPCGKVAHVSQELGGVEAFVAEPQQVRDFVGSVCHKGKLEGALRTDPRQEVLGYLPGVL